MKHKLIFIGNSIVNGFPMSRGRSFPGLVRAALKETGIKCGSDRFYVDVINKGVNGETTMDILGRFSRDVLAHEPAAVFIMTGTNDFIYREADSAQCMENLEKMARMAEEAGIVPVYMTPITVEAEKAERMWMAGMGVDYDQTNGEIGTFSDMIRESGRMYVDSGVAWEGFVNGTDQRFREEIEYPACSADAYLDGVHPTPEGYRFLAEVVIEWLQENIRELAAE